MDSNIETLCLQLLENDQYCDPENLDLDPEICSWNKKKYPELKPVRLGDKQEKFSPKLSPQAFTKPCKNFNLDRDSQVPCINRYASNTPTAISQLKQNFYVKKLVNHDFCKNSASPEPRLAKNFHEIGKISNKSNYLNYLNGYMIKKIKFKKMKNEKPYQFSYNFTNSKVLEFLSKIKSPCLDVKRTHTLNNKLPLSNAQNLEELLNLTKMSKIRKYFK